MRTTYRRTGNRAYWAKRWSDIPADAPMESPDTYPLKYANIAVQRPTARILEAGCGAGRILRHFKARGHDITGIDIIEDVVLKLKQADPTLHVEVGDITNLAFADGSFDCVLAFGLYHNLEHGLAEAVEETKRVLCLGGTVCASFRADNVQTRLSDWLAERRASKNGAVGAPTEFHKLNFTKSEFVKLFEQAGFRIEAVYPVQNMPIFYKFRFFRSKRHKNFDESVARRDGYRLSPLGTVLQASLIGLFPEAFCNVFVIIAKKPEEP